MTIQFYREIEAIFQVDESEQVIIKYPDFDIDFSVEFDDAPEVNTGQITLYNLSRDTTSKVKLAKRVTLNAGYLDNMGLIILGRIDNIEGSWQNTDRELRVDVTDEPDVWRKKINKTYAPGRAESILRDLLQTYGIRANRIRLPENIQYAGGKVFSTTLEKAIREIAKDCKAKLHIVNGGVFIRPKQEGDGKSMILLTSDTGLIGSPERMEEDGQEGYKVSCLLNHRIRADVEIAIESREVSGNFRVVRGKHDANSFTTELEVVPV